MHTIQPIDNPRTSLNEHERDDLLNRLLPTTRSGFGTPMERDDVEKHLIHVDRTYLLFAEDRLVGFSSYDFHETSDGSVLYLSGIALDRSAHGRGLFAAVNARALDEYDPQYFVMRTQNPVIYRGVEKLVDTIYPGSGVSPAPVLRIARHFAGAPMEDATHVVRGLYGTCLYDDVPLLQPTRRFFDECLRMDYARGDSVVIVGERKSTRGGPVQ